MAHRKGQFSRTEVISLAYQLFQIKSWKDKKKFSSMAPVYVLYPSL